MSENTETALIVSTRRDLPTYGFNGQAIKAAALEQAALIGKVCDRDSKIIAVRAMQELKRVFNLMEKTRQELAEPLLNAKRQLDALVAKESRDLQEEYDRIAQAKAEFDELERQRVAEEERKQQEELRKIEEAKQAEIRRIEQERLEAERKAREAQEAAQRASAEAKSKKDKEEAERLRKEAVVLQNASSEAAKKAVAEVVKVEEQAGDAAYVASRPIDTGRVEGERRSTDWEIIVEQPFQLAKFHPDLVDIKPRIADIKAALNAGRQIHGIKAKQIYKGGVRLKPEQRAIDV